jgi:hypothetical protein
MMRWKGQDKKQGMLSMAKIYTHGLRLERQASQGLLVFTDGMVGSHLHPRKSRVKVSTLPSWA